MTYGSWNESLIIDQQEYRADLIDQSYAQRAGFHKLYAIDGLPLRYEDDLVRASQISDVPHTWRVKECKSENEVTEEILIQGREVIRRDREEFHSHIISYVGQKEESNNNYEFLAAGAIRDKLTRDYENKRYPVVSRAIVVPQHRGKGLGSLIVEHRMKTVLHYFGEERPKAIHFGTESKKILHSVKKFEQEEGLKFVYIGDENYQSFYGTNTVHDFLCFLPWFREELRNACDILIESDQSQNDIKDFQKMLDGFTQGGIEEVSGKALEELFQNISQLLHAKKDVSVDVSAALQFIGEVFLVKKKIGARDPS